MDIKLMMHVKEQIMNYCGNWTIEKKPCDILSCFFSAPLMQLASYDFG